MPTTELPMFSASFNSPKELATAVEAQEEAYKLLAALSPVVAEQGHAFFGALRFSHSEQGTVLSLSIALNPQPPTPS